MLATTPVRDDECLTPPIRRYLRWLLVALAAMVTGIGFMVAGFLASAGVFALKGDLVAILVLPTLFGTYGLAKAVVLRSYAG
ncbi:hypothetical protein [Silanimonas sp.]|uniref:hypothetical protein n=1 Tax=Silanimonas sp. TaxID=1929290 RepID=UPI0022C36AA0|nr:hypothetical protein [Silanimonas sp.]MCZ8166348.1 hypothetical protein [Silanimonas sp.]